MTKTERRFTYNRRDDESLARIARMSSGKASIWKENVNIFKPRDGKNIVRILPPGWESPEHYAYDIHYNRNVGVENEYYLSLSKMLGKPDPLAEARKQAETEGNKKLADSLRPVHRRISWVIDRSAEDEGPQLWDAPFKLDTYIVNQARDEDTLEVIMVDDPDFGCDVRFYREGTGMNTKPYDGSKVKLLKPSPLHEDLKLAKGWIDYAKAHPIPDLLNFYDYKHIANVFNGHVHKVDEEVLDEVQDDPKRFKALGLPNIAEARAPGHSRVPYPDPEPDTETLASTLRSRLAARAKSAPFDDDEDE